VNPFAALRTGFEFEAVGVKETEVPLDVRREVMKMVLTVVVMLSRRRRSLARVGAVATT
jgi:hypothetical protein